MTLMRVRLELARSPGFPEGSSARGYDLIAPLDGEGHLDAEAWKKHRADCTVRRFWEGEDDETGRLRHSRAGWYVDYDEDDTDDDEPFYRLDRHRIALGEYLSIRGDDGEMHTFRVVQMHPFVTG